MSSNTSGELVVKQLEMTMSHIYNEQNAVIYMYKLSIVVLYHYRKFDIIVQNRFLASVKTVIKKYRF